MIILNIALSLENDYIADLLLHCNNYNIKVFPPQDCIDKYDIVITDGLDFCTKFTSKNKQIIYLGKNYVPDNIITIKKPFKFAHLIEIIEKTSENLQNYLENNYVILNKITRILLIKSQKKNIILTEKETNFVEYLMKSRSGVTKEALLKDIWNYSAEDSHTIETLVYRLRQKIGYDDNLIETTMDGYKMKTSDK